MERSLLIELIHQTKNTLDSIRKFTELSRGKFSDIEFGEVFYRMITKEIEKNDLLANSFLNYVKVTTPIRKKGTVNALIEEVLRKHQVRLEKKRTKIFRNFEEDLPETIVPNEQLRFVLDSILQYAMASICSDGNIEFLTKSSALQKDLDEDPRFEKDRKYIEILVAFTSPKEEVVSNVLLRLVEATVGMNQGVTRFDVDETKAKKSVFLKLPAERRKMVIYEPLSSTQLS
jgi:signal transduction histidine kinase